MICDKPDRAYFLTSHGEPIWLAKIAEADMDKLLADQQAGGWRSFPAYFTESKRVWPIPPDAEPVKVIFEQVIV